MNEWYVELENRKQMINERMEKNMLNESDKLYTI